MKKLYIHILTIMMFYGIATSFSVFAENKTVTKTTPVEKPVQNPHPLTETVSFSKEQAEIKTTSGTQKYNIEVAETEKQLERGLMYRTSLAESEGMLFVFPNEQSVYMWMKNTFIPLDMLFIDGSGKIVNIKQRATPNSLEVISAGSTPVKAVLELKGGTAEKHKIAVGDNVIHRVFTK